METLSMFANQKKAGQQKSEFVRQAYQELSEKNRQYFCRILEENASEVFQMWVSRCKFNPNVHRRKNIVERKEQYYRERLDKELLHSSNEEILYQQMNSFFVDFNQEMYPKFIESFEKAKVSTPDQDFDFYVDTALKQTEEYYPKHPFIKLFSTFLRWFDEKRKESVERRSRNPSIEKLQNQLDDFNNISFAINRELQRLHRLEEFDAEGICNHIREVEQICKKFREYLRKTAEEYQFSPPEWETEVAFNQYLKQISEHIEQTDLPKARSHYKEFVRILRQAKIQVRSPKKEKELIELKEKACQEMEVLLANSDCTLYDTPQKWFADNFALRGEKLLQRQKDLASSHPSLSQFIEECELEWIIFENQEISQEQEISTSPSLENSENHSLLKNEPEIPSALESPFCPLEPIPELEAETKPELEPILETVVNQKNILEETEKKTPVPLKRETTPASVEKPPVLKSKPTPPPKKNVEEKEKVKALPPLAESSPTKNEFPSVEKENSSALAFRLLKETPEKRLDLLQNLIWHLMVENKFSVALCLTQYLEQEKYTESLWVPSWIIRCVLYSPQMTYGNELLAHRFQENFAQFEEKIFETGNKIRNEGIRLLLASAAFRPALFAPHSTAPEILKELYLGKTFPLFYQLLQEVASYGERNIPLNPELLNKSKDVTLWQEELKKIKEKAQKEYDQTRERSMGSRQAKLLWPYWAKKEGGKLFTLLNIIIQDDLTRLEEIKNLVSSLKTEKLIEKELKSIATQELNYYEGFLPHEWRKMIQVTQEVINLANRWIHLQEMNSEKLESRLVQYAETIKQAVELDESIQKEFETQQLSSDHPLLLAGIQQCSKTLKTVKNLFNLKTNTSNLAGNNWSEEEILYGELLKLTNISLKEDWTLERNFSDPCVGILSALSEKELNWEEAFGAHLKKGNHFATEQILNILKKQTSLPTNFNDLQEERKKSLEQWSDLLEQTLQGVHEFLSNSMICGLFDHQEFISWNAQLLRIEEKLPQETRYHQIHRDLTKIREEIEAIRQDRIGEIRKRLDRTLLTEEQRKRIEKVLETGDIHTTNDYIDRIERNEALPELSNREDAPFLKFFFHKEERANKRGKFFSIIEGMEQIKPRKIADTIELRESLFEMDFKQISGSQGKEAKEALNTWFLVKRQSKLVKEQAKIILDFLGFNVLEIDQNTHGNQTWLQVKTEPLRERALCPVPHFGSQADGQYKILCVWDRPNEEDLLLEESDLLNQFSGHFVFYLGRLTEKKRRDLARLARRYRRKILVLDDVLLVYLCSVRGSRLPIFFQCTLPFSFIEPYGITAGLVPPEMFYGRKPQIDSLIDPQGSSFLYGGRQLGKTAILRYIERAFQSKDQKKIACWIDLNAKGIGTSHPLDEIWSILAEALKEKGILEASLHHRYKKEETLLKQIRHWLREDSQRRILFLLDEADIFLESDAKDRFQRCEQLKGLMVETERRFKVVFAGLHNVQRTTRVSNNPLAHYGSPICIGPLLTNGEAKSARELIEQPFNSLGYFFESPDLVTRILAQTNYYPSLIQIYCLHLLRHLTEKHESLFDAQKTPPYFINSNHVDDAYKNRELRQEIRSRLMLTLDLDKRYRVIAFIFAFYQKTKGIERLKIEQIREDAILFWQEGFKNTSSENDYRELLEEMLELGILRRESDFYALRSPNVVMLLGTEQEITSELTSCHQWEPPTEYEPKYFRRSFDDEKSFRRSPFTVAQESELKSQKNRVFVLSGSIASGLQDVPEAMISFFGIHFFKNLEDLTTLDSFQTFLQQWDKRENDGTTLVLVPETISWDLEWLKTAQEKIKRLTSKNSFVTFLFIANPEKIWQLGTSLEENKIQRMSLQPWHDLALRQWLEDSWISGPKDIEQRKKITQQTGNWHHLLTQFYFTKENSPSSSWETILEELYGKVNLSNPKKYAELFPLFGFKIPAIEPLLKTMAEYNEPLTQKILVELGNPPQLVEKTFYWANCLNFFTYKNQSAILDPILTKLLLSQDSHA